MSKKIERRDVILDAALAIVDRDGLDGLTLRKIEAETGLSAPLVYREFADKAAIIAGLVERLLEREAPLSTENDDARTWLHDTFFAVWRRSTQHAALLPLLASVDLLQTNALHFTEQVLEVLRGAGLDASRAGHAFQVLLGYTIGTTVMARGTEITNERLAAALLERPILLQSGLHLDPRNEAVVRRGLETLLAALLARP